METKKRYGLITGSKCSVLFPKRSAEVGQRTYAKELANQMFFQYHDNIGTWQTEHGHIFEQEAFEFYKQNIDNTCKKVDFVSSDFHGGSADAICDTHGVDFKCPTTLDGWLDYLHDGISDQQYWQCQMYMHLYKKNRWVIAAYLAETLKMNEEGKQYPVPRDKRILCFNVFAEPDFAERLNAITPKIIEMRNEFYGKLKEQFRN
jgi:hypothetical protein